MLGTWYSTRTFKVLTATPPGASTDTLGLPEPKALLANDPAAAAAAPAGFFWVTDPTRAP